MELKSFLLSILPFLIGLIIGAGLTNNKYIYSILAVFTLIMILNYFLSKSISKVYLAKDKKKAIKQQTIIGLNQYIEFVTPILVSTHKWFDALFPVYSFILNLLMLFTCIWLFLNKLYVYGFMVFAFMSINITINQIWRKIKDKKIEEVKEW
jgi:hypothetical protein